LNTFISILTRGWGDNNVNDREVRTSCRSGLRSGEETILGRSVSFDQGSDKDKSLTAIASSKWGAVPPTDGSPAARREEFSGRRKKAMWLETPLAAKRPFPVV